MRLNKITLYKTQLGNDYKNVIDGGNDYSLTKKMLKEQIFDAFYSPYVLYNGETKSYKEVNGETEISIYGRYENILDYNYAIIENNTGYFFYFITGMESLNDGETPSVLLLLERDSWNNNIEYLSNRTYDDMQLVNRSHFVRFYDDGNKRTFWPLYYNSDDYTSFTKYNDEQFMYIKSPYVLWIGFRVSGDAGIKIDNLNYERVGDSTTYDTTGGNLLDSIAPIFYMPIAIISGIEDGIPSLDFSFSMTNGTITANYSNVLKDIKKRMDFTSQIFMEAICTLFPPFNYNVSNGVITVGSGVAMTNEALYTSGDDGTILQIWSKDVAYNPDENYYYIISVANDNGIRGKWYHTYTTPLQSFTAGSSIGTKLWDAYASYNDVKLYEPRVYCSPFYDMTFSWGDFTKHIDVILDKTLLSINVDTRLKTQGTFSLFLDDNALSLYNTIPQVGNLPTSTDKWEGERAAAINDIIGGTLNGMIGSAPSTTNYHYSNEKTTTDKVNRKDRVGADGKLKSTAINLIGGKTTRYSESGYTHTIGGGGTSGAITGAIRGMVNTVERQSIISSQSIHSNQPSVIGSDNVVKQIPKIIYEKWVKESEIDEVLGKVFLYGYTHPQSQSVKYNCRVWFDYCETINCTLPRISNLFDRYTIENAFNRGITKWHYNEGFGINADFDKTRNNPERKYVSAEDAQILFDFTKERPYENRGTLGSEILMDNRTGTYQITGDGLKITTRTTAMIKSNTNLSNHISFGERLNSSTHQIKITEWANNNTYGENLIMCNVPYNSSTANWYLYADSNGALYIKLTSAGGTYNLNANINDCINKTLTLSYSFTGYSIATSLKFYVDGVETYSGSNLGQASSGNILTIGYPSNYNAGMTVAKIRSYYYPDEAKIWTAEEVSNHLL